MTLSERAAKYNNRHFTLQTRKAQDEAGLDFHPGLRVGAPAPDFTVHELDGTTLKLSDFRNKHVVFAFGCLTAPIARLARSSACTDLASLPVP